MGEATDRNLEYIQHYYLYQFLNGDYTKVEFPAISCQEKSPFDKLFLCEYELDLLEEVDKTIICQWLIENKDSRFENYVDYYLRPNKLVSLETFNYRDIFSLISPHNVENS